MLRQAVLACACAVAACAGTGAFAACPASTDAAAYPMSAKLDPLLQLNWKLDGSNICLLLTFSGASASSWAGFGQGTQMVGSGPTTVSVDANRPTVVARKATAQDAGNVLETSEYQISDTGGSITGTQLVGYWTRRLDGPLGLSSTGPTSIVWAYNNAQGTNGLQLGGIHNQRGRTCVDFSQGTVVASAESCKTSDAIARSSSVALLTAIFILLIAIQRA